MRMRHLLCISIVGVITSAAFGGSPGITSDHVEALITRYQESMASRQAEVVDQKQEREAETPRLTVFDPAAVAVQGSWLALADTNQPAAPSAKTGDQDTPVHKGHSLAEINNKLNNPGSDLAQLNFKLIWNEYKGDLPGSSSQDSLTLEFQPVFPFKLPDGETLFFAPRFRWSGRLFSMRAKAVSVKSSALATVNSTFSIPART